MTVSIMLAKNRSGSRAVCMHLLKKKGFQCNKKTQACNKFSDIMSVLTTKKTH